MEQYHRNIIARCYPLRDRLYDNERKFIEDLNTKDSNYMLSSKQNAWLNSIDIKVGQIKMGQAQGKRRGNQI